MAEKRIVSFIQNIRCKLCVYCFKDKAGVVIYVGKAENLLNRVSSYFTNNQKDRKIFSLIDECTVIDTFERATEVETVLLKARFIGQYKPKYNTSFKDRNPFFYIFVDYRSIAELRIVRTKTVKGLYFGPFILKKDVRETVTCLKKTFQLNHCYGVKTLNGCFLYSIGECSGSCRDDFDIEAYKFRFMLAVNVLKQEYKKFVSAIENELKKYRKFDKDICFFLVLKKLDALNDYLRNSEKVFKMVEVQFSLEEYTDEFAHILALQQMKTKIPADIAIQLQQFLLLEKPIVTIDYFGLSHLQGRRFLGCCLRFADGQKSYFRRFEGRITTEQQNNDVALQDIVSQWYKTCGGHFPDLILINGDEKQFLAIQSVWPNASLIGLAQGKGILFTPYLPEGMCLDLYQHPVGRLLIALHDYAHYFFFAYYRLKQNNAVFEESI